MNKRDPNSDIPGFEGEYYGTVGHEKKHHQTHFTMPEVRLRKNGREDYEWVMIAPGRYRRVKKRKRAGDMPEVTDGKVPIQSATR